MKIFINNNKIITWPKHMKTKHLTVKENVKMGEITMEHICIDDIWLLSVNPLIKDLRLFIFERHVACMGLGVMRLFNGRHWFYSIVYWF